MTPEEIAAQLRMLADEVETLCPCEEPPISVGLRTDMEVVPLPLLPSIGKAGSNCTDPDFGTVITRLTDETTANGQNFGTPSAPNLNSWSSNSIQHYVVNDNGSDILIKSVDGSIDDIPLSFPMEPCFSRAESRPSILYYCSHVGYKFVRYDVETDEADDLFNVEEDVGPLSQDANQYMSSCYGSAASPEKLVAAYGATQDLHPYVTVIDVADRRNRMTVNVAQSRIKVNGGNWTPLLRPDGTLANINAGLHSVAIDHSGAWVKLDFAGDYGGPFHTAFLNTQTGHLHEWTSNAWGGHYSLGYQMHVSCIADPNGGDCPQWLLTNLTIPGFPPPWHALIVPALQITQLNTDHNSWNNVKPDNRQPIISGLQRGAGNLGWQVWDEEIVRVSVVPPTLVERVCHHRVELYKDGINVYTFRDSPRPQVSPDNQHIAFTSNWGLSLGTYGSGFANQRRDAFRVLIIE